MATKELDPAIAVHEAKILLSDQDGELVLFKKFELDAVRAQDWAYFSTVVRDYCDKMLPSLDLIDACPDYDYDTDFGVRSSGYRKPELWGSLCKIHRGQRISGFFDIASDLILIQFRFLHNHL